MGNRLNALPNSQRRPPRQVALAAVVLALVAAVALASHASDARAESTGIEASLWPNSVEIALGPGQSAERTLRLDYLSGPPADLTVGKFDYDSTDGKLELFAGPNRRQLPVQIARWAGADWISFPDPPGQLMPGETRQIRLRLTVPENAEPGERRALVMIGVDPAGAAGQVTISPQFGVYVFVVVPGPEARRVENVQLGAEYQGLLPLGGPVSLVTALENTGTVSLRGKGEVIIQRWLGGEVARLPMPDERIVPGERCRLVANWSGPPVWEVLGRYRAEYYFDDETLAIATIEENSFWLVNWISVSAIVAVFAGACAAQPGRLARATLRGATAGARAFRSGLRD